MNQVMKWYNSLRGVRMEKRKIEILNLLTEDTFVAAHDIAKFLGISDRTVRNEIADMRNEDKRYGFRIESKTRLGYKLIIIDRTKYENLRDQTLRCNVSNPSVTPNERIQYLLEYFLAQDKYVKFDTLCEMLYVSASTLNQNLRVVRHRLKEYDLELISVPNKGMKVIGKEFDLRLCIANTILLQKHRESETLQIKDRLNNIANMVKDIVTHYKFHVSDISFNNLIIHIFTAVLRVEEGYSIPGNEITFEVDYLEERIIGEAILKQINKMFNISMPEEELNYIIIHLASKKVLQMSDNADSNRVITAELDQLVLDMVHKVENAFQIDFSDDLELRMSLALHLVPFDVRVRYGMEMKNPLIKEIRSQYVLAYNMAVCSIDAIQEKYGKLISSDEIGYIALHFNLALERKKDNIKRKNILIVCGSGHGSAKLLEHKFRSNFSKYIDKTLTVDSLSLDRIRIDDFDYIISTVPITTNVPIPILEVNYLLGSADIVAIRKVLENEKSEKILSYFKKELFIVGLEAETKDDVLVYMVDHIKKVYSIPETFIDSIREREALASTEFGPLLAIPHPNALITDETFVCIAILKRPIVWNQQKVQVVYLLSVEKTKNSKNLEDLYTFTGVLLSNEDTINALIKSSNWSDFRKIIESIAI